jgi:hypothetical protein
MTTIAPPICGGCAHLHGDLRDPKCDAFPDGIPHEITLSKSDHREPFPGDNGIRFEPKDAKAAGWAAWLFQPEPP